jgi:hypothetical protein
MIQQMPLQMLRPSETPTTPIPLTRESLLASLRFRTRPFSSPSHSRHSSHSFSHILAKLSKQSAVAQKVKVGGMWRSHVHNGGLKRTFGNGGHFRTFAESRIRKDRPSYRGFARYDTAT